MFLCLEKKINRICIVCLGFVFANSWRKEENKHKPRKDPRPQSLFDGSGSFHWWFPAITCPARGGQAAGTTQSLKNTADPSLYSHPQIRPAFCSDSEVSTLFLEKLGWVNYRPPPFSLSTLTVSTLPTSLVPASCYRGRRQTPCYLSSTECFGGILGLYL